MPQFVKNWHLFGTGRLTRYEYMRNSSIAKLSVVIVFVVVFLGGFFSALLGYDVTDVQVAIFTSVLSIAWAIFAMTIEIYAAIQRLHDRNEPGTHAWYLIIPIYGLVVWLGLLTYESVPGDNAYGPYREEIKSTGIVVLYIVTLLGSIAMRFV